MKKVKVPQIYSREHVNYINSIHNMGTLFEDLSFHEEDPARAMSALVSIEQIFASYQAAILDYKDIVYN